MIGKVIVFILIVATAALIGFQIYALIPQEPISLVHEEREGNPIQFDYGDTPVFSENLRFDHTDITYHISPSCSTQKVNRMKQAFSIFEEVFELIYFIQITQEELADITVVCSNEEITVGKNLYTVGEGGPSRIINTSQFKVIKKGTISLYKEISRCNYPVVELHELLHVFGFDHSENPKSIMYNISSCDQRITQDIISTFSELYGLEPKPDLTVKDVTAVKRGRYLDFNITVLNEGLTSSDPFTISIVYKGEEIESFMLEKTDVGYGRTIQATNLRLPNLRVEALNIMVDSKNIVDELNEENNLIQMRVKT